MPIETMRRYVAAYSAVCPSTPTSSTIGAARSAIVAASTTPIASDSQSACAPSLRATVSSPAPVARATWAVVPYWRKLNVARTASAVAAAPRAAS